MTDQCCGTCHHFKPSKTEDPIVGECRWAERRADRDWPLPSYMAVYPTDGVMCHLWLAKETPAPCTARP